jgi:hypothetical protein
MAQKTESRPRVAPQVSSGSVAQNQELTLSFEGCSSSALAFLQRLNPAYVSGTFHASPGVKPLFVYYGVEQGGGGRNVAPGFLLLVTGYMPSLPQNK